MGAQYTLIACLSVAKSIERRCSLGKQFLQVVFLAVKTIQCWGPCTGVMHPLRVVEARIELVRVSIW